MIHILEKAEPEKYTGGDKCRSRPTPGVCTPVELHDETAIEALPGPPEGREKSA